MSKPKLLAEFHTARLFDPAEQTKVEEMYIGILQSWKDFCEQELTKIVRSQPSVQPCVRRRRPQPDKINADNTMSAAALPDAASSHNKPDAEDAARTILDTCPAVVSNTTVPATATPNIPEASSCNKDIGSSNSHTETLHQPESNNHYRPSSIEALKPCSVTLINLKDTNIARMIKPMLKWYKSKIDDTITDASVKISEIFTTSISERNRDSTEDSGVASGEEEDFVPPLKIRIVHSVVPSTGSGASANAKETKTKRRKRLSGDAPIPQKRKWNQEVSRPRISVLSKSNVAPTSLCPIQPRTYNPRHETDVGEATRSAPRPSGDAKATSRSKKRCLETIPSRSKIPVSIPFTDQIQIAIDLGVRKRFLGDFEDQDLVNKTSLPSDVIPTVEFNLNSVQMSPLATRRYKEAPPLQFVPCYGGEYVCIPCNKRFSSSRQLASHQVASHSSALNY